MNSARDPLKKPPQPQNLLLKKKKHKRTHYNLNPNNYEDNR